MREYYERTKRDCIDNWLDGNFEGIEEVRKNLYLFALSITGNDHLSEEAVQIAITRILSRGLDTFYPGSDSDPWLKKIVLNTIRDMKRKEKRNKTTSLDEKTEEYSPTFQDKKTRTYEEREKIELGKKVAEFITKKSRDGKTDYLTLELAYIRGLNYNQISTYLKIPIGTVKSRIGHAKEDLRLQFPKMKDINSF